MIQPFKNREVNPSKPVEMYRCLNRKGFIFSIRQEGKVVGHTDKVFLKDCSLVVNKSGKSRCINDRVRNVHAYVKGTLCEASDILLEFSYVLNYAPYSDIGFHITVGEDWEEITSAKTVYLQEGKIYCQIH